MREQCTDVPLARIYGNRHQFANYKCVSYTAEDTCQRHVRTIAASTLQRRIAARCGFYEKSLPLHFNEGLLQDAASTKNRCFNT